MSNSSRRRFLGMSAALAGRGAISLPILASLSKKAGAIGWTGWGGHGGSPGGGGSGRCVLRGTRILTPSGQVAVEDLAIGTLVETVRGALPVKWIGRQRFSKDTPLWHWSVAPIRVARFALSDQYPHRDLYLSRYHSLFIDGFLIPVHWLVNGTSIALAALDERDHIEYFHLELETHEVIFAEGAPAETLLIANDREDFANFIEYERMYGPDVRPAMEPFAPILRYDGFGSGLSRLLRLAASPVFGARDPIQRARNRIAARAGLVDV